MLKMQIIIIATFFNKISPIFTKLKLINLEYTQNKPYTTKIITKIFAFLISGRRILMKKHLKIIFCIVSLMFVSLYGVIKYESNILPEVFKIYYDESPTFNIFPFYINVKKRIQSKSLDCLSQNKNTEKLDSFGGNNYPTKNYEGEIKLLNIFPIKSVTVSVVPEQKVTLCGTPFGIKIYADGAIIIGISEVPTSYGAVSPATLCGLQKGDIITNINGANIKTNDELEKIIENSGGEDLHIYARRKNKEIKTVLKPQISTDDEKYHAGIWVRDSCAGIGTLTFKNSSNNSFAGLGHGICDSDTHEIMPLYKGDIVAASILDIQKGAHGNPGELKGSFINSKPLGTVYSNSDMGIYGALNESENNTNKSEVEDIGAAQTIKVATKQNVVKGPAKLLTTIDGTEPKYYDINIDSVNYNKNIPTQNIKISVKDDTLLQKTGGIVQGMSGSPIIQNGALVGAVTHVLINNPKKGYAIFAETMLTNSNNIINSGYKNAS